MPQETQPKSKSLEIPISAVKEQLSQNDLINLGVVQNLALKIAKEYFGENKAAIFVGGSLVTTEPGYSPVDIDLELFIEGQIGIEFWQTYEIMKSLENLVKEKTAQIHFKWEDNYDLITAEIRFNSGRLVDLGIPTPNTTSAETIEEYIEFNEEIGSKYAILAKSS